MTRRPDRSTNRGTDRYGEGSRVATLVFLFVIGVVFVVLGAVQFSDGVGRGWILVVLGAGLAVIAALILKLDPPGGRRPR